MGLIILDTRRLIGSKGKRLYTQNINFFNAFHTVVLKINLLETVKYNKYISHRLQGVLYKIQ